MKLVEREHELSVLREMYLNHGDKRGCVVLVSGPPTVGKTALLNVFAETLRGEAAVIQATASFAERDLPFGVVDQLFTAARLPASEADRVSRLMGSADLAAPQAPGGAPVVGDYVTYSPYALGRLLLGLAKDRPVVIAVDDIQYADTKSLETLLYVGRRLALTRVFLVLTESGYLQYEHPTYYAEILRQAHHHHLELRPYSQCGVEEVLTGALGVREGRRLAPMCHALTGGNPLLVQGLVEDHQARGANRPTDMIPGRAFAKAVSMCLYRCDPFTVTVAQATAVLHDDASPAILGELLGLKMEAAALGVDALARAGLAKAGRFRHAAIRQAVLHSLDDAGHRDLREQCARVLHRHDATATVVARHLVAGGVDDPWGVPVLREAAGRALSDDDVDVATGCLRLAHRASTDPEVSAAVLAELIRAEWRTNPAGALPHVPGLLAAGHAGHLGQRDLIPLIACLIWFGQVEEAEEVLSAMRRRLTADGSPDPEILSDLDLLRLWLASAFPDLLPRVQAEMQRPPSLTDNRITPLRCSLLLSMMLRNGAGEDAVAAAERILQGTALDDETLVAISTAILSLMHADRLDKASAWCDRLVDEAERRRAPMWRAQFASLRASIDIRRGMVASAERSACLALTLVDPPNWGTAIGLPLANILLATTAMGSFEDAARYARVPVPDTLLTSRGGLHYLRARGRYYLAIDRPYAALDDFNACGRLLARWSMDVPSTLTWRTDAARAHLALGQTETAREIIEAELARLGPEHNWQRGSALRVLAAASPPERRAGLLIEAVELLQYAGDQLELAYATADLGRVRALLGEDSEARLVYSRAQRLARQCGVNLPRSMAVGKAAGATPAPPAGMTEVGYLAKLSDAELRVAALASQGNTNREIAAKLYITVSTVEQHLTQVYRKLKVNRRNDLPLELNSGIPLLSVGDDSTFTEPQ